MVSKEHALASRSFVHVAHCIPKEACRTDSASLQRSVQNHLHMYLYMSLVREPGIMSCNKSVLQYIRTVYIHACSPDVVHEKDADSAMGACHA